MGYLQGHKIKSNFRAISNTSYKLLNHYMTIISRTPKVFQNLKKWKLYLSPAPIFFQLAKIDCGQIVLGSALKNLNLISFTTNSHQFDFQYKAIFSESPLLNFPRLEKWAFILHHDNLELGDVVLNYFHTIIKKFGYDAVKPSCILIDSLLVDDWLGKLEEQMDESYEFAIIMIPDKINSIELYRRGKYLLTGEKAMVCQFMNAKTVENNKNNEGFYLRILSQIAGKMGYAPWYLKNLYFNNTPTLVIGVNVSFGKESQIISVVGSMNKDFSKYWSIFSVFKEKKSYFNELNSLILQIIEKFVFVHKIYPKNLIVLRDGEYSEFTEEEKEILNKNIKEYKLQQKVLDEELLKFIYIKVSVASKQKVLSVEKINNMYEQRVACPFFGSMMKTNGEFDKFFLYLQRNDSENEILCATKFKVSLFSNSLANKELAVNLQNFCLHLVFLNFSFSSRTSCPAPLQNAFKLGKFLQTLEGCGKDEASFKTVLENLRQLSSLGKLFYI